MRSLIKSQATKNQLTDKIRYEPIRAKKRRVSFYLNTTLLTKAKNALQSQWNVGNYQYPSLSELIRSSLAAYQQRTLPLGKIIASSPAQEISCQLSGELLSFYQSLPAGKKQEIMQRCLVSYLAVME